MKNPLTFIAAIALLACGGDKSPVAVQLDLPVGISVSPTALSLVVGDQGGLTARVFDSRDRVVNAAVEWSVADSTIASVGRSNGIVGAIAPGTTTVSATFGTIRAIAIVSVRPTDPPIGVDISPSGLSLITGRVERLIARVYDSTGRTTRDVVEWSSADRAVATVGSGDGLVTGVSDGTTR